ncbi:MAG: hypothetical protein AUG51_06440 [Acidobacteria bacterium 13_1_20CM_3_53_8]|nr:MAG: hypothetical protein AUG51_06440 [Acidobacteria bacterium 13_1_20CM_3_53_8]
MQDDDRRVRGTENIYRLLAQTPLIYSIADPRLRSRFVRGFTLAVCLRRLVVAVIQTFFFVTSVIN